MIKTALTTIINTLLGSGTNITATELRSVQADLLTNAYGTIINDTELTANVLTSVDANKKYDLEIVKQGRFVSINGFFDVNNTIGQAEFENWFTISNTEYLPSRDHNFFGISESGFMTKITLTNAGVCFLNPAFFDSENILYISTTYNAIN